MRPFQEKKLAEELHCTRAAIWKAVKSLREEGYMIEAGPNKGYMLVKANDRLSVEAIRPFLSFPEGLYQKFYQEVDSTNRAAKAAAVTGEAGHGSFVLGGMPDRRTWPAGTQFLFTAGCRNLPECDPRTERQSSGESASDCRGGSGSLQSSKENYRS